MEEEREHRWEQDVSLKLLEAELAMKQTDQRFSSDEVMAAVLEAIEEARLV